jgi:hypothetical protein
MKEIYLKIIGKVFTNERKQKIWFQLQWEESRALLTKSYSNKAVLHFSVIALLFKSLCSGEKFLLLKLIAQGIKEPLSLFIVNSLVTFKLLSLLNVFLDIRAKEITCNAITFWSNVALLGHSVCYMSPQYYWTAHAQGWVSVCLADVHSSLGVWSPCIILLISYLSKHNHLPQLWYQSDNHQMNWKCVKIISTY